MTWPCGAACALRRGGLGYVVLCKLLSGSGHRLRATSKIGKVTRGSNLLAVSGVSLAKACRAGPEDRWCLGPREPRSFQLRLRTRNNTRQGQCRRAKSIRRILTNDPVEAPFHCELRAKAICTKRSAQAGELHQLSAPRLQWGASFPCRTRHTRTEYPQDPPNRRASFCFHRLVTAGTSDDRRVIHSILHNQPHRSC